LRYQAGISGRGAPRANLHVRAIESDARFTTIVIRLINSGFYLAEERPGLISGRRFDGLPLFQAERSTAAAIHTAVVCFAHGRFFARWNSSSADEFLGASFDRARPRESMAPPLPCVYVVSTIHGF